MRFQVLLNQKRKEEITYSDLLETDEWKECIAKIIKSQSPYCTKCGHSESFFYNGKHIATIRSESLFGFYQGERADIEEEYFFESEKNIYLHVHHKHYILGRLPWEYSNEELTTLCNWCHWEIHQNQKIKVYQQTSHGLEEVNFTPCSRCSGAGVFPEYSHVQSGICFRCSGTRYEELIDKPKSNWFQ